MSNPLATYLQDHLAGAAHAIALVKTIRDQHQGEPLGTFAKDLIAQLEEDRQALESVMDRVGAGSSGLKELSAWLAEKLGRIKLSRDSGNGLGTFEALEFLELGIHGKWAMWRALATIATYDERLQNTDFDHLAERAEVQRAEVERHRLAAAATVLRPAA